MPVVEEIAWTVATLLIIAALVAGVFWVFVRRRRRRTAPHLLKRHFSAASLDQVVVTERQFPHHIRADVQTALERFLSEASVSSFHGLQPPMHGFGGVDFSSLMDEGVMTYVGSSSIGPPQYEQVDIGEAEPLPVLKSGLWLARRDGVKFAMLFAPITEFGGCGVSQRIRVQVATLQSDRNGTELARRFLQHVEAEVANARCYRGKILSLEESESYSGQSSGVKVHRLSTISRENVILPASTLELLDRNVIQFVARRARLRELGMATKKGLLFYGPPGTGKTHTVRYLAGSLADHTTLLISAEQVGLLAEYMTLARLLQPSIVVIEDVDLIARDREQMHHAGTETMLNRLLNEMDGLREDCEILFILTTNRPEQLEAALASRPGRVDQAIEFPLPDAEGREKLVRLYARSVDVPHNLVAAVVQRTEKVSASFIKELMRRSTQFLLERDGSTMIRLDDVDRALDEMLFSGGTLNLKLLGGEERIGE